MTAAFGGAAEELGSLFISVMPSMGAAIPAMATGGAQGADAFADAFKEKFAESFKDLPRESASAFKSMGGEAAHLMLEGFKGAVGGQVPEFMKAFDAFEEGVMKMVDVVGVALPGIGTAFALALNAAKPAFDTFKAMGGEFMETMVELGDVYIEATHKIATATIDVGQIEKLGGAVREIMASGAVVHFHDVADAIGRLNSSIRGLDLEQLKELTTNLAEAEELVGNIDETKFAGVLNSFGIQGAEANQTLTHMANIARATGIEFNMLTDEMQRIGPAMREMGYNADQSATFFARMTQEGEKGTRLIFGMNEVVKKLNDLVVGGTFSSVQEGWEAVATSVKKLIAIGGDAADAQALKLLEKFVTPSTAPLVLEDFKNGILDAASSMQEIANLDTKLSGALEETISLGEAFTVVGQQIQAALTPTGQMLAKSLIGMGEDVKVWLAENQGTVAEWGVEVTNVFLTAGGRAAQFLMDIVEDLKIPFQLFQKTVIPGIQLAIDLMKPFVALAAKMGSDTAKDILSGFNAVGPQLKKAFDFDLGGAIDKMHDKTDAFVEGPLARFQNRISDAGETFKANAEIMAALSTEVNDELVGGFTTVRGKDGLPMGSAEHPLLQLMGGPEQWHDMAAKLEKLGIDIQTNTSGVIEKVGFHGTEEQIAKAREEWEKWWEEAIENPPTVPIKVEPHDKNTGQKIKDSGDMVPPGETSIDITGLGSSGQPLSSDLNTYASLGGPVGGPSGLTPSMSGGAGIPIPGAPQAAVPSSQQGIADYIIQSAMQRGYSQQQADWFATQAYGESHFSPTAYNPAGWAGIFQFDQPTWAQAGGGDVNNAQQNIDNYFRLAAQRGLTPQSFTNPTQLGSQVSIGGPYHPQNAAKGDRARAEAGVQPFLNNFQAGFAQGVSSGIGLAIPAGSLPAASGFTLPVMPPMSLPGPLPSAPPPLPTPPPAPTAPSATTSAAPAPTAPKWKVAGDWSYLCALNGQTYWVKQGDPLPNTSASGGIVDDESFRVIPVDASDGSTVWVVVPARRERAGIPAAAPPPASLKMAAERSGATATGGVGGGHGETGERRFPRNPWDTAAPVPPAPGHHFEMSEDGKEWVEKPDHVTGESHEGHEGHEEQSGNADHTFNEPPGPSWGDFLTRPVLAAGATVGTAMAAIAARRHRINSEIAGVVDSEEAARLARGQVGMDQMWRATFGDNYRNNPRWQAQHPELMTNADRFGINVREGRLGRVGTGGMDSVMESIRTGRLVPQAGYNPAAGEEINPFKFEAADRFPTFFEQVANRARFTANMIDTGGVPRVGEGGLGAVFPEPVRTPQMQTLGDAFLRRSAALRGMGADGGLAGFGNTPAANNFYNALVKFADESGSFKNSFADMGRFGSGFGNTPVANDFYNALVNMADSSVVETGAPPSGASVNPVPEAIKSTTSEVTAAQNDLAESIKGAGKAATTRLGAQSTAARGLARGLGAAETGLGALGFMAMVPWAMNAALRSTRIDAYNQARAAGQPYDDTSFMGPLQAGDFGRGISNPVVSRPITPADVASIPKTSPPVSQTSGYMLTPAAGGLTLVTPQDGSPAYYAAGQKTFGWTATAPPKVKTMTGLDAGAGSGLGSGPTGRGIGGVGGVGAIHFAHGGPSDQDLDGDDPKIRSWEIDRARKELEERGNIDYIPMPPLRDFATGGIAGDGWVYGNYVPGKDTVPTKLSIGSYVINRRAAERNRGLLDKIWSQHGSGSGRGDTIDSMVMPGERVFGPQFGQYRGIFDAVNYGHMLAGGKVSHFEGGGLNNDRPDLVDTQLQYVMQIANSMGLSLTAGRSGHGTHDIDGKWHDSGQAADFGDGSQQPDNAKYAFAMAMLTHFGSSLAELIYDDPRMPKLVKDGHLVDKGFYGADTLAGHRNHVHVAIKSDTRMYDQQLGSDSLGGTPGGMSGAMPGFSSGFSGGGGVGIPGLDTRGLTPSQARSYAASTMQYNARLQDDQLSIIKSNEDYQNRLAERDKLQADFNKQQEDINQKLASGFDPRLLGEESDTLEKTKDRLNKANERLADAATASAKAQRALDIDTVKGAPEKPKSARDQMTPDQNAERLGQGIISGMFQELGFPDVFGKPFTEWGSWKLAMGGLGYGMDLMNRISEGGGGSQAGAFGSGKGGGGGGGGGGLMGLLGGLGQGVNANPNLGDGMDAMPTNVLGGPEPLPGDVGLGLGGLGGSMPRIAAPTDANNVVGGMRGKPPGPPMQQANQAAWTGPAIQYNIHNSGVITPKASKTLTEHQTKTSSYRPVMHV